MGDNNEGDAGGRDGSDEAAAEREEDEEEDEEEGGGLELGEGRTVGAGSEGSDAMLSYEEALAVAEDEEALDSGKADCIGLAEIDGPVDDPDTAADADDVFEAAATAVLARVTAAITVVVVASRFCMRPCAKAT